MDDEVFDEEDLSDGFDADLSDEDLLAEGDLAEGDLLDDEEDLADEVLGEDDAVEAEEEEDVAVVEASLADDEDDLTLDHDVELALDEVLAETMRLTSDTDDDEDATPEVEDKSELTESVLPKQDDEFRCQSCRLLKKVSQLADEKKQLCRDCV